MLKLRFFCKVILAVLVGFGMILLSGLIVASPQGGEVKAGDITIGSDINNDIDTLITQQSQKGIIDWQSFSIGTAEHTHFAQPGANAITLNRVVGANISSILGRLTATGKIFLVNPSGIIFGPNSRIDVAGLLATTANISNEDFLAGNYYFVQGPGGGRIINQGYIKAAENGLVFLVAPLVENTGVIEANLGKVVLGSTPANSTYVLDFYGDQLLQFAISSDIGTDINNSITQSGKIIAHGGKVLLTANTAKSVVDQAINMSGIIEANTIASKHGEIVLLGGDKGTVSVTGKLIARGEKEGESGGAIRIQGERIGLFQNAIIDVSGMSGAGNVLIGARYLGDTIVPTASSTYVGPNANIFANALTYGPGGNIIIWSDQATRFYGKAEARGGVVGGAGGFVETSSKNWIDVGGARVDVSAPMGEVGTWLLDPYNVDIVSGTPPSPDGTWDTGSDPFIWSADSNNSQLYVEDILLNLATANVEVNTGIGGPQVGNISLLVALNYPGLDSRTLSLIAANDIDIDAAITGINLDLILQAGASGVISINNNGININTLTTLGGITGINADAITTVGSQLYNNPVVLGATTTLRTTGAGNITFVDTVNGGFGLGIDAAGNTTFGGVIGGTTPLAYLDVTSGVVTNINTNTITTTGTQ
ncbi:MAG: filamentous hemagglutinin N-terminal domain-containing protein, partial [Gammaproteobacteria bacterium]|nr:filamentous hemagglutinin N-terminal domain-containing protein [Gammaproteobacteria bacterium]